MMEELLPKTMDVEIDLTDLDKLNYNEEVKTCKNLFKTIRDGGVDVLVRLVRMHEALVHKKLPGKSWSGFCKDLGIDRKTPLNWFAKHNLPYTKGKRTEEISSAPKPTRKHTKPETKEQSDEIAKEAEVTNSTDQDSATFEPGNRGDIEKLYRSMEKNVYQLRSLVDGDLEGLDTGGTHIEAIKSLRPKYIHSFAKLGIDPREVSDPIQGLDKGVEDEQSAPEDEEQSADAIDVEFREVTPHQAELDFLTQR